MKTFLLLACALFAANAVLGGSYSEAIRQAKQVSGRVTEQNRQLMNNPLIQNSPHRAAQPAQPAQPANPVLQATLENITNLCSDFDTLSRLNDRAAIRRAEQGLTNDLATAAQGTKPLPQSLAKLGNDLTTVIAGNEKLAPQHFRLAQFVHAAFNGAHLTDDQRQMIFNGVQKILTGGGVAPEKAAGVVNDIKTVANETK